MRLGFSACGLAPAEPVSLACSQHFQQWLDLGNQADMEYMRNHIEKRLNPNLLVSGVKTIVSVAMNYYPQKQVEGICMYAQGRDYHDVIRDKLQHLMQGIGGSGRCFVDTAPVLERYWAWRSGLGWQGHNTQLIIPHMGSTFFLGELFLLEEADAYDTPLKKSCGNCRLCIDACPTQALSLQGLDARRCLSYLTIEHRGPLPEGIHLQKTFYGCDQCQKACPHLKHAIPTSETSFHPSAQLQEMTQKDWQNLTLDNYRELFKGSAVKRAKYEGLKRNIQAFDFPD